MSITTTPHQRRRRVARLAATLSVVSVVASGCIADRDPLGPLTELLDDGEVAELRAVDGCEELAAAADPLLRDQIEAMWPERSIIDSLLGGVSGSDEDAATASDQAFAEAPATTAAPPSSRDAGESAGPADGSTVIGTNNQEVEVDEADLVKTDGRVLVAVVNGTLRVTRLDDSPTIDGSLDLNSRGATTMFLRGDSLLVLGTTYGGGGGIPLDDVAAAEPAPAPAPSLPPDTTVPPSTVPAPTPFQVATTLTLVSIADPARPAITATAEVEGSLVTARELDGRARVVVQSSPAGLERMAMAGSRDQAVAAVEALEGQDLVPRVAVDGGVEPLGSCQDMLVMPAIPTDAASSAGDMVASVGGEQLSTVSVLTVGDDLTTLDPVSVQGSAGTVYASTASLYVAEASWDEAGPRTNVHRFALDGDGPATYTGSGLAPGHLLNQFSLSERDGALRVVTTLDGMATSSARLTVLDTEGTLDEIGNLDGMGIGEEVQSVRFLEDLAYVVTFRQIDPLYALDLSDPRNPRLLGELKIPGFSEYLHPVGEGLLLGVGREVDPDTGIDEGLKISLFDVSDPGAMAEVDQIVLPQAWSQISSDHLAFLWDPARRQAVIPVEQSGCDPAGICSAQPSGAALVVRAEGASLSEVGRFSHDAGPGGQLAPLRTVLVDDDLWSVSYGAFGRTDADAPSSAELLRF